LVEVIRLSADDARARLSELAEVLVDCVEGGASVNFMAPFPHAAAEGFFGRVIQGVEAGERILLAAVKDGRVIGTVQVVTAMPPNQPHRGEVAKLLVHRQARGAGVGWLLMEEAERQARAAGKTLLVLDTVTGDRGERLYGRMGWVRVGVIPDFALFPDGTLCDTTVFYKAI
jgi:GNAT superfamily N-acetyltransferase